MTPTCDLHILQKKAILIESKKTAAATYICNHAAVRVTVRRTCFFPKTKVVKLIKSKALVDSNCAVAARSLISIKSEQIERLSEVRSEL